MWTEQGNKEHLILEHVPTVKGIARRMTARLPPHVRVEDLIGAGVLGLIDAIEKYDPSRSNAFSTYAEYRIRGAILDELRKLDWAPHSVRQRQRSLERAHTELASHLGRSPSDEEIVAFLGIDLDKLDAWREQLQRVSLLRLEAPWLRTPRGKVPRLLERLATDEAQSPPQLLQARRLREIMRRVIDHLPQQERIVISLYYYEECTITEISKVLKITKGRVSQLHTQAKCRLRRRLKVLQEE